MLCKAMDAHPVPQNVTSFQFRLIGDMTLKQFGYLGAGVGFAYLMFVFFAAPAPLVAWPIIVISSFLGIAFAFLPIQDRPLDHWVAAFLKAIYSPTKRAWKKGSKDYKADPNFKNRMNIFLTVRKAMSQPLLSQITIPQQIQPIPMAAMPAAVAIPVNPPVFKQTPAPVPTPSAPQSNIISNQQTTPLPPQSSAQAPARPTNFTNTPPIQNSTTRVIASTPSPVAAAPQVFHSSPMSQLQSDMPSSEELFQTVDLGRKAQALQVKIIESERELTRIKSQAMQGGVSRAEYTRQFNIVFENLQNLVKEASAIKKRLDTITNEPTLPKPKLKVEVVKPTLKPTPIVLTSTPSVINGIVVDPAGNYLDGVVVVIHDKEGLPVRALKTNKLGQFTGSTPLSPGQYNIEIEKDGFIFDVVQLQLDDKVLPPLMISAKSAAGTS